MKSPLFSRLNLPGADICLFPHLFIPEESDFFFKALVEQVNWQQDHLKMFGKEIPLPRLTAWYGDAGAIYTYSRIRMEPMPWLPVLQKIREKVAQAAGRNFNSVLLNYYRTGEDSMGWHADNEPELGPEPVIASVSFGAAREFQFRPLTKKDIPLQKVRLPSGSLLLMQGATQQHWQHRIPRQKNETRPRINLTFRNVLV